MQTGLTPNPHPLPPPQTRPHVPPFKPPLQVTPRVTLQSVHGSSAARALDRP